MALRNDVRGYCTLSRRPPHWRSAAARLLDDLGAGEHAGDFLAPALGGEFGDADRDALDDGGPLPRGEIRPRLCSMMRGHYTHGAFCRRADESPQERIP